MDLLHTVGAELDVGGEVLAALFLEQRRVDEGGLDDVLLALGGLEQALGEAGTGHGHGEGSGTSTILGLHNLVTTELNAVDIGVELLARQVIAGLGQKRDDGSTGVATNDGDVLVSGVGSLDLGDEAGGADDIEGGDTEEALGVVDTLGLEDLGSDGNGGVDLNMLAYGADLLANLGTYRVGDDQDVSLGGVLSGGLGQIADDGGVGVEKIYFCQSSKNISRVHIVVPSRVMPGLRGTPAGMRTISAPLRASARPEGVASYPRTLYVLAGAAHSVGKRIIPRSWC